MADQKNKYEQVIKALECCRDFGDCSLCPYERATYGDELDCIENMHTDALALIIRQNTEIADLQDTLKCEKETNAHLNGEYLSLMKESESQKAEIERLTIDLEAMRGAANSYKMHYEKAKSEVAREIFAEIEQIIENSKYQQLTPFGTEERYNPYLIKKHIAELKKKYTNN